MKAVESLAPKLIHFGTDGWRAIIGEGFTFANLERVTQAYADFLIMETNGDDSANYNKRNDKLQTNLVVIGYDRRFLSDRFAQKAAEILAENGFSLVLFDTPVPTPLVSWSVRHLAAAGGIVITASHNPAEFNGFKLKASWGGSVPSEISSKVESLIDLNLPKCSKSLQKNNLAAQKDCIKSYKSQISSLIDLERLRSTTAKIIVDPMHGSGGDWVESFLQGGKLEVETIRENRDLLFGGVNPEPIEQNLVLLKKKVIDNRALVGLATDGDADRIGIVNELGETTTMHQVAPLLLLHLLRNRKMIGGVVTTFSQSVLMKRIAAAHNLPIYETPIGFKYIAELMLKENILIGAEESGGIGIHGHIPERDGILNSLLFLEAVICSEKKPSEMVAALHREFGEFHFDRIDLRIKTQRAKSFIENLALHPPKRIADESVKEVLAIDGVKLIFDDDSWLLFRLSGTEPMMRIYSEATSKVKVKKLIEAGTLKALGKL